MDKPSLAGPEFDSAEDKSAYERWFVEKVRASLADARPTTSHASVMADLDKIIDAHRL